MEHQTGYTPQPGDVEGKLRVLFPNEGLREAARGSLRRYGAQSWHKDLDRVRLAVLKLAGDDLTAINRHVDEAAVDHRDTLAAAEFPSYTALGASVDRTSPAAQAAIKADRAQYLAWVKGQ